MPAGIKSQLFLTFPAWGLWGSSLSKLLSLLQEATGVSVEGEIDREKKQGLKTELWSSKKQQSEPWLGNVLSCKEWDCLQCFDRAVVSPNIMLHVPRSCLCKYELAEAASY